jgi:hypothetical protein
MLNDYLKDIDTNKITLNEIQEYFADKITILSKKGTNKYSDY